MKYERVASESSSHGERDETVVEEIEIATTNPMLPQSELYNRNLYVKVLNRETTYEIRDITPQSTITEFKKCIASASTIPEARQRLSMAVFYLKYMLLFFYSIETLYSFFIVFNGKPLKPEINSLNSFGISNNSCVHLFPIPEAVPVVAPSSGMTIVTTSV